MTDVIDASTRSKNMAAIRGKDTKPEVLIRKGLYARGFRYRLHYRKLPGRPDIVFPKYRALILVNGCFWHRHNCHLFKWPGTRENFWREKIEGNVKRDKRNLAIYKQKGWRTAIVWECALKGRTRRPLEEIIFLLEAWLRNGKDDLVIGGSEN